MTDQDFVFFYQQFAVQKLAKHLSIDSEEIKHLSKDDPGSPHDLEYNGQRYQIKMARPSVISKTKKFLIWDFDVRADVWDKGRSVKVDRPEQTCDFYILIGIKDGGARKTFLLPFEQAPASHVRISIDGESKYNQYEI